MTFPLSRPTPSSAVSSRIADAFSAVTFVMSCLLAIAAAASVV